MKRWRKSPNAAKITQHKSPKTLTIELRQGMLRKRLYRKHPGQPNKVLRATPLHPETPTFHPPTHTTKDKLTVVYKKVKEWRKLPNAANITQNTQQITQDTHHRVTPRHVEKDSAESTAGIPIRCSMQPLCIWRPRPSTLPHIPHKKS